MAVLRVAPAREWVKPGESIAVRVAWHLDRPADRLEVRLLWYTEGRGTRDVGIAAAQRLDGRSLDGEVELTFTAPVGPYSFTGRLIALRWALELAAEPDEGVEQVPLIVAPTPAPVALYAGS